MARNSVWSGSPAVTPITLARSPSAGCRALSSMWETIELGRVDKRAVFSDLDSRPELRLPR